MTVPAQTIGALVEPLVTAAGLELWDVEVGPRSVRVLVDRPGGVDLDALTGLARAVSSTLDGHDDVAPGDRYQLEVSSPGVERPLRTPEHYRRYLGAQVNVKTTVAVDGARRFQGTLVSADQDGITLEADSGTIELPYGHIQKAKTVLVWGATARPQAGVGKGVSR